MIKNFSRKSERVWFFHILPPQRSPNLAPTQSRVDGQPGAARQGHWRSGSAQPWWLQDPHRRRAVQKLIKSPAEGGLLKAGAVDRDIFLERRLKGGVVEAHDVRNRRGGRSVHP